MITSFKTVGAEHQSLVVVDDFHSSPEELVASAKHENFVVDKTFYPGVRALAPISYAKNLANFVSKTALPHFGLENYIVSRVIATYACVTLAPEKLHILQRVPHFDSSDFKQLACIHYLSSPELSHGGTAFYRHNETGYEYIDSQRVEIYKSVLSEQIEKGEIQNPPKYICGDNLMFTKIHCESAIFNRLLIYRSTSLHSGLITDEYLHQGHPADGRLTITSFIALSASAPI